MLEIVAFIEQAFGKLKSPKSAGQSVTGVAAAAASSVPFASDVVGAAMGERPYEISPAAGLGRAVTEIAKPVFAGKQEHLDRHLFENSLSALGYLFDLPTDQAAIAAEGLYNWGEPGYEPWNVLIKPPAAEYGPRRRRGWR
jgi:hypothetical protein